MLFSAIPQYFFRKTDEWFGPSCQATNMRYRHSEVSLFPFIQAERRMKRYEKPDTSFRAMHSQGRADKPGFSELQCHDSALGLTHGDEVYKANMSTLHDSSMLQVAACCSIWKVSCVFISMPVMYITFTPWLKFCVNFTQSQFFSYSSIKTSTTVNQRCTVT